MLRDAANLQFCRVWERARADFYHRGLVGTNAPGTTAVPIRPVGPGRWGIGAHAPGTRAVPIRPVGPGRWAWQPVSSSPGDFTYRADGAARMAPRDGTVPTWMVTMPPDMPIQRTPTRPASRITSAIRSGAG